MIWIIFLLMSFLPNAAQAKDIRIAAGDHEGFTRIVLTIPLESEWKTNLRGSYFVIEIPEATSFDTDPIFEKIQRSHISSVESKIESQELILGLNCQCEVNTFLYQGLYLVIDFIPNTIMMELSQNLTNEEKILPPWWVNHDTLTKVGSGKNINFENDTRVNVLSEIISENISIAAANGRLESQLHLEPRNFNKFLTSNRTTDHIVSSKNPPNRIGIGTLQSNDTITNATSICNEELTQQLYQKEDAPRSLSQISRTRTQIYDEFGKMDESKIIDLSLQYIRLGLAAEARSYTDLITHANPEKEALSYIIEAIDPRPWASQIAREKPECGISVNLWNILHENNASNADIDHSMVLLSFKSLPTSLQKAIYDRILKIYMNANLQYLADEIQNYMSTLDIWMEINNPKENQYEKEELGQILKIANRDRPELIVTTLGEYYNQRDTTDIIQLSESIRFENQETELWSKLLVAEITAGIASQNYSKAIEGFRELANSTTTPEVIDNVYSLIAKDIIEEASDSIFITFYLTERNENWPDDLRLAGSARMEELGFSASTSKPADANIKDFNLEPPSITLENSRQSTAVPVTDLEISSTVIQNLLTQSQELRNNIRRQIRID